MSDTPRTHAMEKCDGIRNWIEVCDCQELERELNEAKACQDVKFTSRHLMDYAKCQRERDAALAACAEKDAALKTLAHTSHAARLAIAID